MAVTPIDDFDCFYFERGSGPPLLLIMGFTANSDWWPPPLLRMLSRHYRLIVFDNRGSGRSGSGKRAYTIQRLASDAMLLLDHLNIEKTHVFGVSMGGMIAQQLALDHPERVDHLILGCTSPGPFRKIWWSTTRHIFLLSLIFESDLRKHHLLINLLFGKQFLKQHPEIVGEFRRMVAKARMKPLQKLTQLRAMRSFNLSRKLSRLKKPTLIIHGDADMLVPFREGKRLKRRIPHAEFVVLEHVGHAFVAEALEPTAERVLKFLPGTPVDGGGDKPTAPHQEPNKPA